MKKDLNFNELELLDEARQLQIFGGNSDTDEAPEDPQSPIVFNVGKGCGTLGDCKKICIAPANIKSCR